MSPPPAGSPCQSQPFTIVRAKKRASCERCHRFKERCTYEEPQKPCRRCLALGKECHSRTKRRMGRRPVAQQLPYGATSIILFAGDHRSVETDSGGCSQSVDIFGSPRGIGSQGDGLPKDSNRLNPRLPCRKNPAFSDATTWPDLSSFSPPNFRTLRPPVRSSKQVNYVLESADGFFAVHRPFMLGRSFLPEFHSVVRRLFTRSPQILADAYAVALNLLSSRHATSRKLDEQYLAIGAHCLQRLMGGPSSITRVEDAAVLLLLGQALLVYNTLIPSPDTHIITRGTLLSVRQWYPALIRRSDLNAVTMTPVLMDTIECLIRREVPVIQVPPPDHCVADRFVGLCSSLLPLLYELCVQSHQAKTATTYPRVTCPGDGKTDRYCEIEKKIRRWTPELPSNFFTAYSSWEANLIRTQARCYRIATLLVIHRLRFPLGMEDEIGQSYADEILQDLSSLKAWPSDAATGVGLDFPLLVSTLELIGPGVEMYKAFEPFRFRRQHSDEILDFIRYVDAAKESGFQGLWFELIEQRLLGVNLT